MRICKRCDGTGSTGGAEYHEEFTITLARTGETVALPAGWGFVSRMCTECNGEGETAETESE